MTSVSRRASSSGASWPPMPRLMTAKCAAGNALFSAACRPPDRCGRCRRPSRPRWRRTRGRRSGPRSGRRRRRADAADAASAIAGSSGHVVPAWLGSRREQHRSAAEDGKQSGQGRAIIVIIAIDDGKLAVCPARISSCRLVIRCRPRHCAACGRPRHIGHAGARPGNSGARRYRSNRPSPPASSCARSGTIS